MTLLEIVAWAALGLSVGFLIAFTVGAAWGVLRAITERRRGS